MGNWVEELTDTMQDVGFKKGYQKGYADAIEDFVRLASSMPTVEEDGYIRPMWLEEMAEILKEHTNE